MSEEVMMSMKSKDGEVFEVPVEVARMSKMFNETIPENDDEIEDKDLDCPKVLGKTLKKVVEFCTQYKSDPLEKFEVQSKERLEDIVTQEWYFKFISQFKRDDLFPLIQAANYLDIQPLLELSVLAICVEINNKPAEKIREIFNIPHP
mmetsp:Transcript_23842/g.30033  ORF Transcript_23842/g.30033 Transcript_23842/m.30033 type:complete len:148 (-) Transcript_23842:196-639(-)|eukprot:CAMPEP_0203634446 /NCGR_PEP_ID=MMETSP0088-20131115/1394_1 /ASSEMBLY_ACC=CAM_ASM_001087 /TAXON_ID=426623 /ORGANISM="Chaetoceros affinis, Strain CCMP159" /LENGTH=147 /DNA_ID=CAMNT_0050488059 /DNA_START=64 /DNA_END=507 /DNA_ORIENTATION=+